MATKPELPHSEPGMSIEEAVKETIETTQETSEQEQYKEKATEKVKISTYIRIFTYATRWDLFFLFAAILAQIGAGITMPLMNIIFGNLVGSFSNYFTPGSNTTQAEFTRSVNRQTLFFVYIWIAKFSLCYIAMFSLRIVGIRVSAAIRLAYLRALFAQSISVLDTLPPGSAASTITGQANLLQIGISEKLGNFFQNIALLIAAYTIAFVYSWKLTLVTSSLLLFIIITYSGIVPFMIMFQKEKDHADTKAVAIASEVFGAIRMVKACGAEARVAKRFAGWIEESRKRGLKLSPLLGAQFSPFYFAMFADFALTFWYGIHLFIKGEIASVGTVLIVLMSVLLSVMSISQVFVPVLSASKAAGAAASFFAIIDRPRPESQGKRDPEVSSKADIVFNDAVFAYPSRAHVKVLDGLNVTFETGKLTAIVGPSGSGKSTVVGLLERWYDLAQVDAGIDTMADVDTKEEITERPSSEDDDPTPVALSGSVTIGGHDIRTLNMKWWRAQIGLVQQEPFMFNDTIHANVAYGLVGTQWEHESEEQKRKLVEVACVEAFADEFIDRLPLGYETIVGESGIKLSGGQRQRLAIARSIIKRPQILIFDEATSAIDVRGERKVQAALDQVSKNRTTITIAHRLSTIKKADKIVVVKKGKVIEQGSHEELISTQGVYHDLVFAQSLTMEEPTDEEGLFELAQKKTLSRTDSIPGAHHEKDDVETAIKELVYKPKGVFSSFGLLLIEQKRHLIWLYLTIIGALGAAVAQPMQAYLMAQVISVFESTSEQALSRGASYWALRFLYLAIGVGVAYFIIGWASNSFSMHISCTYRQEYFESITKQPISFFDHEDHSLGTLTSRISSDPTQLQEMMGTNMAMAMTAFFTIIGSIAISFSFGWKLTLVSIFSALPIILSASYYRLRFEIQFEKMNAAVFAESSKFAAEAISAFRTVTSLTLEEMICERYAVLLHDHVEKAVRKARWASLVLALSDSVNLLCMALAFWYGGKLMASHEYTPLIFLIIYVSIVQGSEQAGIFMSFGPNFAQATAAANRILAFRLKDSAKRSYSSMPAVKDMERPGAKLEFRNIAFRYPTREIPIFRNLNLTVAAGQFAALVGPSGCGKTSIISILEQFYPISSGSIHFDGVNLNDLDVDEYRKAFSLVAQEATLFQGSIKDNLLLGVDEGSATQEQMEEACRQAEIHTFIESLPEGYRTDIGSRGVALSGGQRQRLSIARALLRNPRVLLLDEATSSLDSESERAVQKAFERAGKGRTMVVVAHRLATVQNADVIFVLGDGGKIAEKGTHKDLVSRRGVYWQMCQSQALDR